MNMSVTLILVIGLPLILLALGFFLLSLKLYRSKARQAREDEFISLAQTLERNVNELETRVAALEEIIVGSQIKEKTYNQ
jgi:hypothetical protein